jgi:hypothetical protein
VIGKLFILLADCGWEKLKGLEQKGLLEVFANGVKRLQRSREVTETDKGRRIKRAPFCDMKNMNMGMQITHDYPNDVMIYLQSASQAFCIFFLRVRALDARNK